MVKWIWCVVKDEICGNEGTKGAKTHSLCPRINLNHLRNLYIERGLFAKKPELLANLSEECAEKCEKAHSSLLDCAVCSPLFFAVKTASKAWWLQLSCKSKIPFIMMPMSIWL